MTALHHQARFDVFVAAGTAVAVAVLFAWSRDAMASMAGFALLALPGFRRARRGSRGAVADERDQAINQRANVVGYSALWIGLVAWGVTIPLRFGDEGSVPLGWVVPVVWVGWWLLLLARAITILVLDERGL